MPSTAASTCTGKVELRVQTEHDRLRGKLRMRFGGGRLPQLIEMFSIRGHQRRVSECTVCRASIILAEDS
jgi:hypothetical protein